MPISLTHLLFSLLSFPLPPSTFPLFFLLCVAPSFCPHSLSFSLFLDHSLLSSLILLLSVSPFSLVPSLSLTLCPSLSFSITLYHSVPILLRPPTHPSLSLSLLPTLSLSLSLSISLSLFLSLSLSYSLSLYISLFLSLSLSLSLSLFLSLSFSLSFFLSLHLSLSLSLTCSFYLIRRFIEENKYTKKLSITMYMS